MIEGTVDVANFPTYQKVELFDSAGGPVNSTGSSLNVFVTNTIQESNQAVNLCSGTGTTISSTANFLDVNVANTGSIAVTSDVIQIGGDAIYLGSNTSTNSIPVVIASDQSAIYTNANLYDSAGNGITSSMGSLTVHDDSNAHDIDQNLKTADQNMSYTTGSLNVNITNTNNSNVNLYDSAGNGITSAMGSLTVHDDSNAHDISMNLKTADQNMSYTTGSLNVNITNTNNSPVNLYDSAGNGITSAMGSLTVYDNSNAHDINQNLKVADQNNTYTTGSLNVNVAGGNVGVVSFPTTHTGGVLWNAATVANTNTSPSVNMTGCFKNVYTVMATCSDAAVLTVQYSPDNSTWFNTSNILNVPFASSLALDFYSSAGYIRLIASGIAATSVISAWVNHL